MPEDRDQRRAVLALEEPPHAFARDALPHTVIDPAAGKNDLRVVARFLCPVSQIVRVDPDTVAANKARIEFREIPLRRRSSQYVAGINAESLEDGRKFVHERDIESASRVLNDLCRLRDLYGRRAMDTRLDDRAIDVADNLQRPVVLTSDRLADGLEAVLLIPGLIRSGEYPTAKSLPHPRDHDRLRLGTQSPSTAPGYTVDS